MPGTHETTIPDTHEATISGTHVQKKCNRTMLVAVRLVI